MSQWRGLGGRLWRADESGGGDGAILARTADDSGRRPWRGRRTTVAGTWQTLAGTAGDPGWDGGQGTWRTTLAGTAGDWRGRRATLAGRRRTRPWRGRRATLTDADGGRLCFDEDGHPRKSLVDKYRGERPWPTGTLGRTLARTGTTLAWTADDGGEFGELVG